MPKSCGSVTGTLAWVFKPLYIVKALALSQPNWSFCLLFILHCFIYPFLIYIFVIFVAVYSLEEYCIKALRRIVSPQNINKLPLPPLILRRISQSDR